VLVSLLMSHLSAGAENPFVLPFAQMGFSMATPIILMLYLLAMRAVFSYENAKGVSPAAVDALGKEFPGLRLAMVLFGLEAMVVALAGLWLPFASVELAESIGWSRSFVGTMFVALATTLPELAVTLSALRMGALDMAIGNLLGSNLFNVAIIAVDDLFYRKGSLLVNVSLVHAITASSALIMTGLAVVGLFLRPRSRVLRAVGWVSVGLAMVYVFNTYFLYLHGD
jgi:cation:H+ antiporter